MTIYGILPDFSSAKSIAIYFIALCLHISIFLLALLCLNTFIFKPVIKILHMRKETIDEAERKTNELEKENKILLEEYRWRMDGVSQLAEEKKDITELIGRCRGDMLLMDVRRETNRDLDNVIKSSSEAFRAVKPALDSNIKKYAKEITDKIIEE